MIEGISGVIGRISEINSRIEEIKSLGKKTNIDPIKSDTSEKENKKTDTQSFSDILKQAMNENGKLPGQESSNGQELSKINQLAGSNNDSKELLEILYKNLRDKESNSDLNSAIDEASETFNVDKSLIKSIIHQESEYNKNATSKKGAMGLMQLMPDTAELLGIEDPYNARENIIGGTRYLKMLLNKYGNNLNLALAAYNAGPDTVDKFGDIPPYEETQNYVKKVLMNYNNFKSLE